MVLQMDLNQLDYQPSPLQNADDILKITTLISLLFVNLYGPQQ